MRCSITRTVIHLMPVSGGLTQTLIDRSPGGCCSAFGRDLILTLIDPTRVFPWIC